MQEASEVMEFEKAIEYRELLGSVKQIAQKQKITNTDGEDKDIIAMASDDTDAVVQVFFIRSGKRPFSCTRWIGGEYRRYSGEFCQAVLLRDTVYSQGNYVAGND